ncbi:hypothetical protein [Carboxylicivirga sp. N1Y90]|uniref:hypothetical protein n=1 Tax=Carboxylicivirga fragile TaxID=3417571 RepID=UPI003D33D803|nr:hypothetical protein [Marinilabiliaceae bacterium N1Y90]
MFKYFLILSLWFISVTAMTTNVKEDRPAWLDKSYRYQNFSPSRFFIEFRIVEHVKRSVRTDAEFELEKNLKQALAQNIYSDIRSEKALWQNELVFMEQNSHNERFINKVSIQSDIQLLNSDAQTYYNKKEKRLYGFIYIEKKVLAEHYHELLSKEVHMLKAQLNANGFKYQSGDVNRQLIQGLEQRFDIINKLSTVIISCGATISELEMQAISELRVEIDKAYQFLDMQAFNLKLKEAQKQLLNKDYEMAYQSYLQLLLVQPDDARVRAGLNESRMSLEAFYMNEIASNINRENYHQAIIYYDGLFSLIPSLRPDHQEIYSDLERKAYDYYVESLKDAIKAKDLDKMNKALGVLERYKHINTTQYARLKSEVEEGQAFYLYEQAKNDYYDGQYEQSIKKLRKALILDDGDYTYKAQLNKAQNRIYERRLHALKMTRPHIYCFQVGAGAQNNFNMLDKYLNTEDFTSSLMGVYTVSIYRKFGIKDRVRSNGHDRSRARLAGFRYTYINARNAVVADADVGTNTLKGIQELEFVYGISTGTNIALGMVSHDLQFETIENNQFLSATFSKRIYFSPIEFSLDLKAYINEKNVYPVLRLSGFVNLNFKRKIQHSDRKRLRAEVEREY